jgi:uncharacterized protein (DUF2236 family)
LVEIHAMPDADRAILLPLHDDVGIVTDMALEQQLELVSASVGSPQAGIFGPESMTWQINREAVIFLAAGRALLLQLAHPWIAQAVADHSRALSEPISRFHRTFKTVFALVFGTVDQAFSAARNLHRRHSRVIGVLPTTIGPFKAGSPYCANNISALRWVYATLIDSALVAHDLVLPELTDEQRARHYAESFNFAGMFGIRRTLLPADYAGLIAYTEAMCDSDILTVSDSARRLGIQIFAGGRSWLRVPASYRAITAGLLPERVRRDFGFSYGDAERRSAERALELIRRTYPLLPARLRYVAPYHEARERVGGKSPPRILTQLLNRLWIGQRYLAD